MKIIGISILLMLMLSTCKNPIAEKQSNYSEFEEFKAIDPFKNCDSVLSKNFIFKIEHEHYTEKEFRNKILVVSLSGLGEIYRGDFKNILDLSGISICKKEWYSIRFDLLDKQLNKHYWWSNLESYPLAKYSKINITLYSKRKYKSEEEISSFDIQLK